MPEPFAPTIRLSPRQHDLLWMDSYGEYDEQHSPAPELADLRAELSLHTIIHLSPVVIRHLIELADRDQDPAERLIYRNLLRKAKKIANAGPIPLWPLYPFQIEQHTEGKTVEVRVRNAPNHEPPHVQFEVYADEVKGNRTFAHSASFTLTPEQAAELAGVISPDQAKQKAAPGLLEALEETLHFLPDTARGNGARARARAAIAKAGG